MVPDFTLSLFIINPLILMQRCIWQTPVKPAVCVRQNVLRMFEIRTLEGSEIACKTTIMLKRKEARNSLKLQRNVAFQF